MVRRSGRFRVYRVVESVPHYNLQRVDEPRLYTVYSSGYDPARQAVVDDLTTGAVVDATLSGDPDDDTEPWRLAAVDHDTAAGVETAFAVDADPPAVAVDAWEPDASEPICRTLTEDGEPVGACCVQPRAPLPNGAFVPNVLTGLLPLEAQFQTVPGTDAPAAEAVFVDPAPPSATSYDAPFGVVLLFTDAATELPDRFRDRYDLPRGTDTRPAFDPYAL